MSNNYIVEEHDVRMEHVVIESPKAEVINFPGTDLEWLARDCMSTPYATIIREED